MPRERHRKKEPEDIVLDDTELQEEPPFDTGEESLLDTEEEPIVEKGTIIQITYKTNKNLGNQEHRSVEITSTVNEDVEDVEDVYSYLQETAYYLLDV